MKTVRKTLNDGVHPVGIIRHGHGGPLIAPSYRLVKEELQLTDDTAIRQYQTLLDPSVARPNLPSSTEGEVGYVHKDQAKNDQYDGAINDLINEPTKKGLIGLSGLRDKH